MKKRLIFTLVAYVISISAMEEIPACRFVPIPEHYKCSSIYTDYIAGNNGVDLAAGASCILTINELENIAKVSYINYEQLSDTQYKITHLMHERGVIYINDVKSRMFGSRGRSIIVIDSTWAAEDDALEERYREYRIEKKKNKEHTGTDC